MCTTAKHHSCFNQILVTSVAVHNSQGMYPLHVIVIVTTQLQTSHGATNKLLLYQCSFHSDACAIKAYWAVEYITLPSLVKVTVANICDIACDAHN